MDINLEYNENKCYYYFSYCKENNMIKPRVFEPVNDPQGNIFSYLYQNLFHLKGLTNGRSFTRVSPPAGTKIDPIAIYVRLDESKPCTAKDIAQTIAKIILISTGVFAGLCAIISVVTYHMKKRHYVVIDETQTLKETKVIPNKDQQPLDPSPAKPVVIPPPVISVVIPPPPPSDPTKQQVTQAKPVEASVKANQFPIPKILYEIPMITKLKITDIQTNETKECEVTPVLMGKSISGNCHFRLIPKEVADRVKDIPITQENAESIYPILEQISFGYILLNVREKAVYIVDMKASESEGKTHKNVGNALHELAIRYSFEQNRDGNVEFISAWASDGFHFKFGYRYKNPSNSHPMYNQTKEKADELCRLCEDYLAQKRSGNDVASLAQKIVEHPYYMYIKKQAKEELRKDPTDVFEAINYGLHIYWDLHKIYDRFYFHPQENIKSKFCNPVSGRFKNDGAMYLPESERKKWRELIV